MLQAAFHADVLLVDHNELFNSFCQLRITSRCISLWCEWVHDGRERRARIVLRI